MPDAKLDDGKFTLLIIKESNLAQILHIFVYMLNGGKHVDNPQLIYKKTNKVEIIPLDDDRLKVNLDGEYGGDAPMLFTDLQQHIEFIANRSGMPEAATVSDRTKQQFMADVEKLDVK